MTVSKIKVVSCTSSSRLLDVSAMVWIVDKEVVDMNVEVLITYKNKIHQQTVHK